MKLDKRLYQAVYYVHGWDTAAAVVNEMTTNVVASFGCGDQQGVGIDLTDEGSQIILDDFPKLGSYIVRITVTVPVLVPKGYWFSPFYAEGHATFDHAGGNLRGEAASWGLAKRKAA